MSDILYEYPAPDGTTDPCDIPSMEAYVDSANDYLQDQGLDQRLAIYEKKCAVVFPMTAADYAIYIVVSDAEKEGMYQDWLDSIANYPPA